jgi:hypothetical protein
MANLKTHDLRPKWKLSVDNSVDATFSMVFAGKAFDAAHSIGQRQKQLGMPGVLFNEQQRPDTPIRGRGDRSD